MSEPTKPPYRTTPFEMFVSWMDLAAKNELNDFNAMTLITVGQDGMPSSRMLLLKGYDPEGFIFYSNYHSRKGQQLSQNPKAAINFYWKSLRRQVMVEGLVSTLPKEDSDAYFASRPRGSQIGSWASMQSQAMTDRDELEERVKLVEHNFEGHDVIPRPENWGGYRLIPLRMEFWQDGPYRLHNRVVFLRETIDAPWVQESLYP